MYCRKCATKGDDKINMDVEIDKQCYVCPECGHVVDWDGQGENDEEK